ncbi:dTMP kinase [Arenibaculum sp.]|uniref:dTMP kinase n=1 Tax=Arenibaculum sp. TaxID=2865862 RepID=UPI0039C87607
MERGRFITLEGGEGAGKSTQLRRLAAVLAARGIDVVATREPGGSPGAEEIRGLLVSGEPGRWDPMTELLLHLAARRDHLLRKVRPALDAGRWVLSDRFADSSVAYQGYGHGLGRDLVVRMHELAIGDFRPDLTVVLDLPVATGMARARGRGAGEDRYERMGTDFHERLRAGFLDLAAREPGRCAVVDADAPADEVEARIRAVVEARLGAAADKRFVPPR